MFSSRAQLSCGPASSPKRSAVSSGLKLMIQAAQRYEENAVQIDLDGIFVLFEAPVGRRPPAEGIVCSTEPSAVPFTTPQRTPRDPGSRRICGRSSRSLSAPVNPDYL